MFRTVNTPITPPDYIDDVNGTPSDDLPLVQACLRGESHAFPKLYQRHSPKVRSTLYQLCGADGLDDLVQDVFLRAWRGLPKFRQTAQFATWLYRITFNVASDRRKALAIKRSQSVNLEDDQLTNLADDEMAKIGENQSALNQIHYQDLLHRSLRKLSDDHRAVLVLHDLEELPQKEIAEILGIPVGTVKSRLFHARSAIKKFLEAEGVEL
ncbi:MAG: sigma-70 family RNA polymerase sigma factor [Pseudanabaenaceae cyanobacterium bins.39]|nr:sigma-70 family RNA polymerase sigma factor [Pseudanabaenaceae cyanobacterium bins.39]